MSRVSSLLAVLLLYACDQAVPSEEGAALLLDADAGSCDGDRLASYANDNARKDTPILIMQHGGPGGTSIPMDREFSKWLATLDHMDLFEVKDFQDLSDGFPSGCSDSYDAAVTVNNAAVRKFATD